jgi:hypothetical protein
MENKAPNLQMQPDDILYIPNSMSKVIGARGAEAAIGIETRRSRLALKQG